MSNAKWRPGLMTWFIIGGLVLVNVSVFLSGGDPQANHRFLHHFNPWHWPGWYAVNLWLVTGGLLTALFLKNNRVQTTLHFFYSSRFWHSVKVRFKKSKPNQTVVRFILRRKFGKWLLRKWLTFWKNIRIERYPAYAWMFALTAIFIVVFIYSTFMTTSRFYLWLCMIHSRDFFYSDIYKAFYVGPLVEFMSGTITWRLFIAPTTGLLLIVWLLRLVSKTKKRRKS